MEQGMSKITLKEFEVINSSSAGFTGSSRDRKWTTKDFERNLRIKFIKKKDMELEFDIIGVDASVTNAFRRILLSEVPSMAFEKVYIYNNTSIIQDEVLAHRLGLIPLKADPTLFEVWILRKTTETNYSSKTLYECDLIFFIFSSSSSRDRRMPGLKVTLSSLT